MKRNIITLSVLLGVLAACHSNSEPVEYVEYAEYSEYDADVLYQPIIKPYEEPAKISSVKYSVPKDGDLTLETSHHIVQIQGTPGTAYEYRVWAGDKTYDDDPDLIVDDEKILQLRTTIKD